MDLDSRFNGRALAPFKKTDLDRSGDSLYLVAILVDDLQSRAVALEGVRQVEDHLPNVRAGLHIIIGELTGTHSPDNGVDLLFRELKRDVLKLLYDAPRFFQPGTHGHFDRDPELLDVTRGEEYERHEIVCERDATGREDDYGKEAQVPPAKRESQQAEINPGQTLLPSGRGVFVPPD